MTIESMFDKNPKRIFADRVQAAEMLNQKLVQYHDRENVIVLGIPRGGVVLADALASQLNAEMDIMLTRKIGAPHNPELAVGAVTEDGKLYLDDSIVTALGLSHNYIDREKKRQVEQIHQRKDRYRAVLSKRSLRDKQVILTDDGVATGSTMQAAIWAAIAEFPRQVILAVPVASDDALKQLARDVDEVVCLSAPAQFGAISQFYRDFEQVDDEQVIELLQKHAKIKAHD